MARIIVLVGMMGSGKTTVGKRLASKLGCDFIDTDDLVVSAAGKTVRAIFEQDGEPRFRTLEAAALRQALISPRDAVVAAAGGVVLADANRAALREHASCVLWLDADVTTLGERASRGAHRPLIDDDPTTKLAALDRERRSLYESVADVRIDTAGLAVDDVVAVAVAGASKLGAS